MYFLQTAVVTSAASAAVNRAAYGSSSLLSPVFGPVPAVYVCAFDFRSLCSHISTSLIDSVSSSSVTRYNDSNATRSPFALPGASSTSTSPDDSVGVNAVHPSESDTTVPSFFF